MLCKGPKTPPTPARVAQSLGQSHPPSGHGGEPGNTGAPSILLPSGATSTSVDSKASPAPSEVTARTRNVYFLPCSTSASVKVVLSAGAWPALSHALRPACCLSTT